MRGTPFLKQGFVGGLNSIDSPYTLQDHESRDLLNVVSTTRGSIKKRSGTTTAVTGPAGVEFHSAAAFTLANGNKVMILAGGGNLYSVINGVLNQAPIKTGLNPTARWEWVQAPITTGIPEQGGLYGVNGVDPPQQWDGAAKRTWLWAGVHDATHYGQGSYVPNGRFMVWHQNRIWMAGVNGDPSGVFFSDIVSKDGAGSGDPSAWPLSNLVRFDSSDGQPITGLGIVGPYVVVFKARKCWVIHDTDTGANRKVSEEIGTIANRSIVATPSGTFFLTADSGIYMTDGSHLHEMSYNVRPTILAANPARIVNAAGAFFNNHYYLSYATGASVANNRTLDYDLQLKSWWLHDLPVNDWLAWAPQVQQEVLQFAASGVTPGQICTAFVPGKTTDSFLPGAGVFAGYWRGPWHAFGYYIFRHFVPTPFLKKRVRQVHFDGDGVIQPVIWKNFSTFGTNWTSAVNAGPISAASSPTNFEAGQQVYANTDTAQAYGGDTYNGVEMIYGGISTVSDARLYALGTFETISVEFGNSTDDPFEVDSYMIAVQFRKS